jgi:hypothetical protein
LCVRSLFSNAIMMIRFNSLADLDWLYGQDAEICTFSDYRT